MRFPRALILSSPLFLLCLASSVGSAPPRPATLLPSIPAVRSSLVEFHRSLRELPAYRDAVRRGRFHTLAGERPAHRREVAMVPAPGGVRLRTSVYLPPEGDRFPALVCRTPYNAPDGSADSVIFRGMADYYCPRGYAVVIQSLRGKYGSEGRYELLSACEIEDAAALFDWIVATPWSDGRIAIHGVSHDGFTALAGAATNHSALRMALAGGAPADAWTDAFLGNGTVITDLLAYLRYQETGEGEPFTDGFRDLFMGRTLSEPDPMAYDRLMYGRDLALWDTLITELNRPGSEYWRRRQILDRLASSSVPIVHIAGWRLDGDMPDVFRNYALMAARALAPQRLVVGWWTHGQSGPYLDPTLVMHPYLRERFDAYVDFALRETGSPLLEEPPVQVYVQGRDQWVKAPRWPLDGVVERTFYMVPGPDESGKLSAGPPEAPSVASYTTHPLTTQMVGIVFQSEPLTQDLQLMGSVRVNVHLEVDAPDTDLYAILFRPDAPGDEDEGFNLLGKMRARYRDGRAPRPLEPGRPVELSLTYGPLGHRLRAGERLGLIVVSQLAGTMLRNNHTGRPIGGPDEFRGATQRIHCGPATPSRLVLSVLP